MRKSVVAVLLLAVVLSVGTPDFATAAVQEAPSVEALDSDIPIEVYRWAAGGSSCGIDSELLLAVADSVSNHGRIDGFTYDEFGTIQPSLYGERVDGSRPGVATILDNDEGELDSDVLFDRPLGPMQFLPTSWFQYGVDANNDGVADPQNLWDASASAAAFLCAEGVSDGDIDLAVRTYVGDDSFAPAVLDLAATTPRLGVSAAKLRTTMDARAGDTEESDSILVVEESMNLPGVDALLEGARTAADGSPAERMRLRTGRLIELQDDELLVEAYDLDQRTSEVFGNWTDEVGLESATFDGMAVELSTGENIMFGLTDDVAYSGDWNGDGLSTLAVLRHSEVGFVSTAEFIQLDSAGHVFGTRFQIGDADRATPLIGDWDGDGIDSLAVRRNVDEETDAIQFFDRYGDPSLATMTVSSDALVLTGPADVIAILDGTAVEEDDEFIFDGSLLERTVAPDGEDLELVNVAGIQVAIEVADAVEEMIDRAADDGILLQGWGWRSNARQIELREAHCDDIWTSPPATCSPPTALPGSSRHEFGVAIDFHNGTSALNARSPEFRWLAENAATYGFFNLPSEPWHWSIDGR